MRAAIATGTTMPETSVHEDGEPTRFKNEIRLAEYILIPAPACDAVLPEKLYEGKFRALIVPRTDARHDFRSFCFCEDIGHDAPIPNRSNRHSEADAFKTKS